MSDFDAIKYQNDFNKRHYDRIVIMVPKGKKDELKTFCKEQGFSMNEFIISAVREKLERM